MLTHVVFSTSKSAEMRIACTLFALLLCGSLSLTAQSSQQKKADKYYEKLSFSQAIPHYIKSIEQYPDAQSIQRLADCYRLTQQYTEAINWYGILTQIDSVDAIVHFYYAQSLMASEYYSRAQRAFENYSILAPDDPRGPELAEACAQIENLDAAAFPCEITNLARINSAGSEYGAALIGEDKIIFSSNRDSILGVSHIDGWYSRPFLDLFEISVENANLNELGPVRKLKGINEKYHEGPAFYDAASKKLFYTRSQYGAEGDIQKLEIAHASPTNMEGATPSSKWKIGEEQILPFNQAEYSTAHPSLSEDGKWIFFSSDMTGGYGGSDLYVAFIQADGLSFGQAKNLGPEINSPGDELFPNLHADGHLYYSSNGKAGYGGLDIFDATPSDAFVKFLLGEIGEEADKPEVDDLFTQIRNLGRPINSAQDDFGLVFNSSKNQGILASNRLGGKGSDDLYFVKNTGIQLKGLVYDEYTEEKLQGARLSLYLDGQLLDLDKSDKVGAYDFSVSSEQQYKVVAEFPGYKRKELSLQVADLKFPAEIQLDFALEDSLRLELIVQVLDKDTRIPLGSSAVLLFDKCRSTNTEFQTDSAGLLKVRLEPNCSYYLAGRALGYLDDNDAVNTAGMDASTELATVLELTEITEDLVIELKNIYYDYGRYYIREDAVGDLDNLVDLMERYPSLKIEISSHTDARGSDEFNKRLSQKRAETCVDYLATKGIASDRLVARGYGEYVLKNHCANDVDCSEEEHQTNRRTEFKVLSFDKVLYSEDVNNPAVNLYKKAFGEDKVNRTRQDMIDLGLIDAPKYIYIERDGSIVDSTEVSAREGDIDEQSGLLGRQESASVGMFGALGDEAGDSLGTVLNPDTDNIENSSENPLSDNSDGPTILQSDIPGETESADPNPETGDLVEIETASNPVPDYRDDWWKSGVSYAVQIAYGSTNVDAYKDFLDLGKLYVDQKKSGVNVIILGYFDKFSDAHSVQQLVRGRGLSDAFVVSYVDGQRLE